MYKLIVTKKVAKEIIKLNGQVFSEILNSIAELKTEPRPKHCKKLAGKIDQYRIRVGNFRVIYEVSDENKFIEILVIKKRDERTYKS